MRSTWMQPARYTRYALVLLLATVSLGAAARATTQASARVASYTPRFEAARCQFKPGAGIVLGVDVRCGFVAVPEDRALPHGRTVRVAVAVFKNPAAGHHTDPFIFLQGGPGGALISQFGPLVTKKNLTGYVKDRDLVMVDQRGTGYSTPSLSCTEVDKLTVKTLDQNLTSQQSADLQVKATQQCYNRLVASGISLSAYNTIADAADVADVDHALGYESVNIYGVSYGTRLALTIMRTQPRGVRSVILDSVVSPDANQIAGPLSSAKRVYDVLFRGCLLNAACNRAFPHLESTFYRVVTNLNAHPVTIDTTDPAGKHYTALLNGDSFVGLVFQMLYVTSFIPYLPVTIARADQGDFRVPSAVYGQFVLDFSTNLGLYLSVECGEDGPSTNMAQITATAQPLNPVIRSGWLISQLANYRECQLWRVHNLPAAQKQPVVSNIPTLILSGEYDPITPPAQSLRVARTLSRGYRFVFPGMGHGEYLYPLTNIKCPYTIASEFLDDPTHAPNATCIGSMTEPKFFIPGQ